MRLNSALVSALMTIFISLTVSAGKWNAFIEQKLDEKSKVDVIVYLKQSTPLSDVRKIAHRKSRIQAVYDRLRATASSTQTELLNHLRKKGVKHQAFYIENAVAVFGANRQTLESISQLSSVGLIRYNSKTSLDLPDMATVRSQIGPLKRAQAPSHLQRIKVDKVWKELGVKGAGIVIAGQDTGYYWRHNAIKKQYRGFSKEGVNHNYNWHDAIHTSHGKCGQDSREPCDDRSHGTHTMGTMVGDDGRGNRIGVAPEARWIGCRNMDNNVGSVATYLECFQFFLAPYPYQGNPFTDGKPELAPHIMNNSWGCPPKEGCTGGEFADALKALKAAGIFVVTSAGNSGSACGTVTSPPAIYSDLTISVGAYNRWLKDIAYFSSRGPSRYDGGLVPHLTAPGTLIRSAVSKGVDSYDEMAGTSMASPHIAGVVALMWSAKPDLIGKVDATAQILKSTATPIKSGQSCGAYPGRQIPNAVFGYGMVNAYRAVRGE